MDDTIRRLCRLAVSKGDKNLLAEAFNKIKSSKQGSDASDALASDTYVILAEAALELKDTFIADDTIKSYFQRNPPADQFLCRAYYVQAFLSMSKTVKTLDDFEKAGVFIVKGISLAKNKKRLHFLVFNGSVIYWSLAREYFRPNFKQFIAKNLSMVVNGLNEVEDKDTDWRVILMINLIECFMDGGKKDEAYNTSVAALTLAKSSARHLFRTVFETQVKYKLIDSTKLSKDWKPSNELTLLYKIFKLKFNTGNEKVEADTELNKLIKSCQMDEVDGPPVAQSPGKSLHSPATSVADSPFERCILYIEMGKLCLDRHRPDAASKAIAAAKANTNNSELQLEIEYLACVHMVESLGSKREVLTASTVETIVKAITLLEDHIASAKRLGLPSLIQIGCVTMWNLCLPLLNSKLRQDVKKPLTLVAELLEEMDSLLLDVRCQIHMELAKVEEDFDQIKSAISHVKKSMELDEAGIYQKRLSATYQRLNMRTMLYKNPDRPEDMACMMIEQARTSKDLSATEMKRVSLTKGGLLLAPDAFQLALDGESVFPATKKGTGKDFLDLEERVNQYEKAILKISGHLKRIGNVDDVERVNIWVSLIKAARKAKLWNLTRAACRFCLLYDDERFTVNNSLKDKPVEIQVTRNLDIPTDHLDTDSNISSQHTGDITSMTSLEESDMLRLLCEVHFIFAEANIQLLMSEGYKLLQKPTKEEIKFETKKEKLQEDKVLKAFESYSNWISKTGQRAVDSFHRTVELGLELCYDWMICNAAIYIWNYTNHVLVEENYRSLVPLYHPVYEAFKSSGVNCELLLICKFCCALAQGFMQPQWTTIGSGKRFGSGVKNTKGKAKDGRGTPQSQKNKGNQAAQGAESDSLTDMKTAVEILEYALNIGKSGNMTPIPLNASHSLIKAWVKCKHSLGQPLPKSLLQDDEKSTIKALYGLESLAMQIMHGTEIVNWPTIQEVVKMVENCNWEDRLIEIECWCNLTVFAFQQSLHPLVEKCSKMALDLQQANIKTDKKSSHKNKKEQELLYYAVVTAGQSINQGSDVRIQTQLKAIGYFRDACRFATEAMKYHLVMNAAHHFWKACQALMSQPSARRILKGAIREVLDCISVVSKEVADVPEISVNKTLQLDQGPPKTQPGSKKSDRKEEMEQAIVTRGINEDLSIRTGLYVLLFIIHIDEENWKLALQEMDNAMADMPRTHHRLLIVKYRVFVKAKLGETVQFDTGRFKDEDELTRSLIWLRVARNTPKKMDQLAAYQSSIEMLKDDSLVMAKVEVIIEFSEWLFRANMPYHDSKELLLWAADLLVTVAIERRAVIPDNKAGLPSARQIEKKSDSVLLGYEKFMESLTDIQCLTMLMVVYVRLADITWGTDSDYFQFVTTAAHLAAKVLEISIKVAEKSAAEGLKPGDKSWMRSPEKEKKGKEIKPEKTKTCVPSHLHLWANFELPEKIREYFVNDIYGEYISKKTILRPITTYLCLDSLLDHLDRTAWLQYALPVIQLMFCIADVVIEDKSFKMLSLLRNAVLCQDIELPKQSMVSLKDALSLRISPKDRVKVKEFMATKGNNFSRSSLNELAISNERPVSKDYEPGFCYRIWTKIGKVLIGLVQYQEAREVLEDANMMAHSLQDREAILEIKLNLATLAVHEGDIGKSLSLSKDLELHEGDSFYWLRLVSLLADSLILFNKRRVGSRACVTNLGTERAKELLERALDACDKKIAQGGNAIYELQFARAGLLKRLALLIATSESGQHSAKQQCLELLRLSYTCYKDLTCITDSVTTMLEFSDILKSCISDVTDNNDRGSPKETLLQCLTVVQEAVSLADQHLMEIEEKSTQEELLSMCLPVSRIAVLAKIACIEVLLCISREPVAVEEDGTRIMRPKSINQFIDYFVASRTPLNKPDDFWRQASRICLEEALSIAASSLATSEKMVSLQWKIHCCIGDCFLEMARAVCLDGTDVWDKLQSNNDDIDQHLRAVLKCVQNAEELKDDSDLFHEVQKLKQKHIQKALKIKGKGQCWIHYMAEAVDSYVQGLKLGLLHRNNSAVSEIAFKLLECYGPADPVLASQLLAMYQTAEVLKHAESMVSQLSFYSHTSKHATLMNQRNQLLMRGLTSNGTGSALYQSIADVLQGDCEVLRRLQLSQSHYDFGKNLSYSFTFVILHHSPDGSKLYASVIDKSKTSAKKRDPSGNDHARIFIAKQDVDEQVFKDLKSENARVQQAIKSEILRQGNEEKTRKETLTEQTSYENCVHTTDQESANVKRKVVEEHLQKEFENLVVALQSYCGVTVQEISQALSDIGAENVVLLCDTALMQFPIEALPAFQNKDIKSLTRDFSIQIFYQRFIRGESVGLSESRNERNRAPKKDKGDVKTGKSDKTILSPSTTKKTPKELAFAKDTVCLDLGSLKYVIDPLAEMEDCASRADFGQVVYEFSTKIKSKGTKLTGVHGADGIVSENDIIRIMEDSCFFLLCGSAKFFTYVRPTTLLGLNLSDCQVIFAFDLNETILGSLHEGKRHEEKSLSDVNVEGSVDKALLLSLAGCCCLVSHQWSAWAQDSVRLLQHLFEGLLENEHTVGNILRSLHCITEQESLVQINRDLLSPASSKNGDRKSNAGKARLKTSAKKQKPAAYNQRTEDEKSIKPSVFADRTLTVQRFNTVVYGIPNFAAASSNT